LWPAEAAGAARRFRALGANDGWDACVNHAAHAEPADEVVDSARACGRHAIAVAADVSRKKDVLALFAACEDALGAPTGLVNNAGIVTGFGRLDILRDDRLRRTFEVNTISYFLCARSGEADVNPPRRRGRRDRERLPRAPPRWGCRANMCNTPPPRHP
jgi:NAD(P)-dependent dehydrogenase (short-subunit alcohol dehydrogenase family)